MVIQENDSLAAIINYADRILWGENEISKQLRFNGLYFELKESSSNIEINYENIVNFRSVSP